MNAHVRWGFFNTNVGMPSLKYCLFNMWHIFMKYLQPSTCVLVKVKWVLVFIPVHIIVDERLSECRLFFGSHQVVHPVSEWPATAVHQVAVIIISKPAWGGHMAGGWWPICHVIFLVHRCNYKQIQESPCLCITNIDTQYVCIGWGCQLFTIIKLDIFWVRTLLLSPKFAVCTNNEGIGHTLV